MAVMAKPIRIEHDNQFAGRVALIVCAVALAAGWGTVWWWAHAKSQRARAGARIDAEARLAGIEPRLARALGAVQTLAALARQGGGTLPNFQSTGPGLLAAWPGVAWIDLEPGGVVSDIVPRAGHERALGLNVLNDLAQRTAAQAAAQWRAPAASAPVAMDRAEPCLVLRAPVILRGRDGRDFCSGYVAAGLRLKESLASLRLNELAPRGYDWELFLRDRLQPRPVELDARGRELLLDPEQQSVRLANLDLCLALQPRSGWVSKAKVGAAGAAVLVAAGLLWVGLHLLETGRAIERSLGETHRSLAREMADRKQGQEVLAGAQAELKQTRAALQQSESVATDLRARADAAARAATEAREALQAKLAEAEAGARDLQTRLDAAARSARGKQAELAETQTALQAAKTRVEELAEQNRKIEALKLEGPTGPNPAAWDALQARVKEQESTIADLQARLEAATASAGNAAEDIASAVARLDQLEDRNRKLKARLAEAEGVEARLAETTVLLEAARAELARLSTAQPVTPGVDEAMEAITPAIEAPGLAVGAASGAAAPPAPAAESPPKLEAPPREALAQVLVADAAPPTSAPSAPEPPANGATAAVASAEDAAKPKPAKPGRPRKERRDGQLDFFATAAGQPARQTGEGANEPGQASDEPAPADDGGASPPEATPAEAKVSRAPRSAPPVNPGQLRKAINQIMPLFAGQDPGAEDCLKDNRGAFRSAFTPEAYPEFEQAVKGGEFTAAIEHLKKAARRHGISV